MTPKITNIQAKSDYRLYAKFQNGKARVLDISPYLNKGIFRELRNKRYFKKVRIIWGGIEWPHEQDLSAETLYYQGTPIKRSNNSHKRWRRLRCRTIN